MFCTRVFLFSFAAAAFAASDPTAASIPADPLELVPSQLATTNPRPLRPGVTRLLNRARNSYALRSNSGAWDLKVTFTVDSGGQTDFDGTWKMEDIYDPQQGWRWTASTSSYSITRLTIHGQDYGTDAGGHIPLRLQEARAALFDPMPGAAYVARAAIRTSDANWKGASLNCVLVSATANAGSADAAGRRWDETESCIDPQSGLLRVHSQVPGRYYEYDYSTPLKMGTHVIPSGVTVTEAGRTVSRISVESLTPLKTADPSLFVPTDEMKAAGLPIHMAEMQKVFNTVPVAIASSGAAEPVCIFGLLTPSGELVEAHSLQPGNPNSALALSMAKQTALPPLTGAAKAPQQRFVFVIESFAAR